MVDTAKIINWVNGDIVVNLFLFLTFSFVAVSWLFSRYSFIKTTSDTKLLMVSFEVAKTLESDLSVWTEDEFFSVCSFLVHSRTWGCNELI